MELIERYPAKVIAVNGVMMIPRTAIAIKQLDQGEPDIRADAAPHGVLRRITETNSLAVLPGAVALTVMVCSFSVEALSQVAPVIVSLDVVQPDGRVPW